MPRIVMVKLHEVKQCKLRKTLNSLNEITWNRTPVADREAQRIVSQTARQAADSIQNMLNV